jgi:hypothetical protein
MTSQPRPPYADLELRPGEEPWHVEQPSLIVRVSPQLLHAIEGQPFWRDDGVRLRAAFTPQPHPPEQWATEVSASVSMEIPPLRDRLRYAWRVLTLRNRIVTR